MKNSVTVILTCHNRCEKTINCIKKLNHNEVSILFVVVDDASSDETINKLKELKEVGIQITLIEGTGSLFWAGGMREGIKYAKENTNSEYYLLVNDDVDFFENIIDDMVEFYKFSSIKYGAIVGATCDYDGLRNYGGILYKNKSIMYEHVGPEFKGNCDTFNTNCVLLNRESFMISDNIDEIYVHSLGDFDYGLQISKKNGIIKMYERFVGVCVFDGIKNTWQDTSLGLFERLRKKESVKGAPFRQWFHFLKKNWGIRTALVRGFTPYIRIIVKK